MTMNTAMNRPETIPSPKIAAVPGHGQDTLLSVKGLHKSFGGQKILDGLSLTLNKGEVVLLRGDNGSGKTTLLNILTGYLEPEAGLVQLNTNGNQVNFNFPRPIQNRLNPVNHFTPEHLALSGVGRTWQEIRLFKTQSVIDNISMAVPNQLGEKPFNSLFRSRGVSRQEKEIRNSILPMLKRFGLGGRENSTADKISLGQSKRVAIMRAVYSGASVLFLDEPLAGLDADGCSEIVSLLKSLVTEKNLTLVIVEHPFNIPKILSIASTVWTLKDGRIQSSRAERKSSIKNHPPDSNLSEYVSLLSDANSRVTSCDYPGGASLIKLSTSDPAAEPPLLDVKDLVVYRGKRLVVGEHKGNSSIHGLDFNLRKGEIAFLQAPNSWGKTSLMEALTGIIPAQKGDIKLDGRSINKLPVWQRSALGLSFLQARNNIFPNLTVKECYTIFRTDLNGKTMKQFMTKRISSLSGGEKQKTLISGLLEKSDSSVYLLDEPFSALDEAGIRQLCSALKKLAEKSGVLIAVPSEYKTS